MKLTLAKVLARKSGFPQIIESKIPWLFPDHIQISLT